MMNRKMSMVILIRTIAVNGTARHERPTQGIMTLSEVMRKAAEQFVANFPEHPVLKTV